MTSCQAQEGTQHLNNIRGSTTNYEGYDVEFEVEMVLVLRMMMVMLM
jgi:hypothetical protein